MRLPYRFLCALLALSAIGASQELKTHNEPYRIQRSDVLEIHYRYTPEFDQTVSVGPDGQASILGFGTIAADGLSVDEFRARLVKLSSARLVNPEISVLLKEYVKPAVFVGGEVNSPGRFEIHGRLTALDAVALAGGMKSTAKASEVLILRRDSGQTRVVDLKKLIHDHKLEEAPDLRAGDVIYVTQSGFSKAERIIHLGQFGAIYNPIR
jgi:polysaccharide export outer membrane protein